MTVVGRPTAETMIFDCKSCGGQFHYKPSIVRAYRKKHGKDPMYCSIPCSSAGRKSDATARNTFDCAHCGTTQNLRRRPSGNLYYDQKFCDKKCKGEYFSAAAVVRFNAGITRRHTKRHGYLWVSIPPGVNGKRGAILEHRLVMSRHLRRPLTKEETVHHKDGDRRNNDLSNLELFSSRHGPGQRVTDKVSFAIEMLRAYPEFAKEMGFELVDLEHAPKVCERKLEVVCGALSMAA